VGRGIKLKRAPHRLARTWKRVRGWHWSLQAIVLLSILLILVVGFGAFGFWMSHLWEFRDQDPDRGAPVVAHNELHDGVTRIVYLDQGDDGQNWEPKESLWFDNITQGSDLLPYDFFLVLEQADGKLFRSDENINNHYRYLPRKATTGNPDALPIGMVKDHYRGKDFMGFTCAACHTGQINYKGTGIRIDGAPAMADMDSFISDLGDALQQAQSSPLVHRRFVANVLALKNYQSEDEVNTDLRTYILRLKAYSIINQSDTAYGYGRLDAFGRIYNKVLEYVAKIDDINEALRSLKSEGGITQDDLNKSGVTALLQKYTGTKAKPVVLNGDDRDQIMEKFAATLGKQQLLDLRDQMFNRPDAPVSYPFLWDIPQHDYVQWNGIAANADVGPLGRNAGEVIGVFGSMNWSRSDHWTVSGVLSGQGLFNTNPLDYSSSVNVHNLALIEDRLKKLHSPIWPKAYLPPLDQTKIKRGEVIFDKYCQSCHAEIDRLDDNRRVVAHMSALENINTDPKMAMNGATYKGFSGILRNSYVGIGPGDILIDKRAPVAALLTNAARGVVSTTPDSDKSWTTRFAEWAWDVIFSLRHNDIQASMKSGDYNPDTSQAPLNSLLAYKGRSLNGIWATAPYLHNGSVPNLYDLLLPAAPEPGDPPGMKYRPATFMVGSREFDPVNVGFESGGDQGFKFDTSLPGNRNTGHEYGTRDVRDKTGKISLPALTDPQRMDLIEYMKSL
jgi:cytochrome c5